MNWKKHILAGLLILFAVNCGEDSSGPSDDLSVTVTAPPSGGASAVDTYTVSWTSTSSGTVSLFYNTVAGPINQHSIASDLAASGSYSWDLSGVADGEYFVRAIITSGASTGSDWSDGTLTVNHSSGDPAITVTTPPESGASADTSFAVGWVSSGYSDGVVNIYLDTDTDPSSGLVEIAKTLEDTGEFIWDCTSFTEGYYYVYAVITDSVNTNSDYSAGILTVDHGGLAPDFYITKPPTAGAQANNLYTIQWESTAPLNSTVDLYYDTDTDPSSGLVEISKDVFDDGYFSWNCSSVAEGSYYIYGVLETPTPAAASRSVLASLRRGEKGTTVTDYSNGTLTIAHAGEYSITVTNPPLSGASADSSYQITWTTDAPSTEPITLLYAADTTGSELLQLATLEPPVGTSYNWDCSSLEAGSYYIYAVIGTRGMGSDWSAGSVEITHEDEYLFTMTTPPAAGAEANEDYLLEWQTDAPGAAYVSLYYAESTEPGGGTADPIISGIPNNGQYNWNCASVDPGEYYVYGVVSDSRNRDLEDKGSGGDWSDGTLTIDHTLYTISITAPSNPSEPADTSFQIEWVASAGAGCVVDLYYDTDTNPTEMILIEEGLTDTGSYDWDCYAVVAGDYYIYGIIHDPEDARPLPGTDGYAQDYSEGTVLVSHEYNFITVTAPPAAGAYAIEDYTIYWAASSQAGAGTVDLYYDTDTDPSSGLVPITTNLSWDLFNYLWDCSAIPVGSYYIYAEMENPSGTYSDYSDGTLTISNLLWFYIDSPPPPGATADDQYDLEWQSTGPDGRLMDLYYDTDTDPSSGLVLITEDVPCEEGSTTWGWNCSAVPEGTYYIYGVLSYTALDNEYTAYSEGMLTINH